MSVLAGCAELATGDCGGDAYQTGGRDGRIDAYAQAERYGASVPRAPHITSVGFH